MWCSSRNTGARRFTVLCANTWAPCSGGWRDWGRAPDGRSCAHADVDSAEILGIASDGVYERQECHPHCADLRREAKELCGAALLGARVLGLEGGTQRSGRPAVYPRAREGRPTSRSVGTVRGSKPL